MIHDFFIHMTNSFHFSCQAALLLLIHSLYHLFKHMLSDFELLLHSSNIFRGRVLVSILKDCVSLTSGLHCAMRVCASGKQSG